MQSFTAHMSYMSMRRAKDFRWSLLLHILNIFYSVMQYSFITVIFFWGGGLFFFNKNDLIVDLLYMSTIGLRNFQTRKTYVHVHYTRTYDTILSYIHREKNSQNVTHQPESLC